MSRCTASSTVLDNDPSAVPRTHVHTDALRRAFSNNLKSLWDGYGVVGDIIVRFCASRCYLVINSCIQPFTSQFPRADIHELLAPDLLHQIIKGTFKDHLVTWVMEYVEGEHGKNHANQILADIDRR
jgi:hypothetical protein